MHESAMVYAGTVSMFSGELPAVAAGNYDLQVVAADAEAVNFGMASRKVILRGGNKIQP